MPTEEGKNRTIKHYVSLPPSALPTPPSSDGGKNILRLSFFIISCLLPLEEVDFVRVSGQKTEEDISKIIINTIKSTDEKKYGRTMFARFFALNFEFLFLFKPLFLQTFYIEISTFSVLQRRYSVTFFKQSREMRLRGEPDGVCYRPERKGGVFQKIAGIIEL